MSTVSAIQRLQDRPELVAPRLLGAHLVSTIGGHRVVVRIVEVEAYAGVDDDPGSHAHRGRTARNGTMFERPGLAYVYFTYGMHWCLNVVAHRDGAAGAVLLRAGEVVEGAELARARRSPATAHRDLARGPARLTQCLGVTGEHDAVDLLDPDSVLQLRLRGRSIPSTSVERGPRTGVSGAGSATPWRFHVRDDPFVSPYRRATSLPR